jgi:hypothetical protein
MSGPLPRSTTSAVATNALKDRDYLPAMREWLAEGRVIGGAAESIPLDMAVTDLEHGEVTDSKNKAEYSSIIAVIKNLAHLPDAMDTPAQDAQARADVVKIDKFFHLLVISGCNWPSARKSCWAPAASRP